MKQLGIINIYLLIAAVFIVSISAAFYLGTKMQTAHQETAKVPTPSVSASPKLIPSSSPQIHSQQTPTTTKAPSNSNQSDMGAYFVGLFPKDIPVYPGAKMYDYEHYGAMNQGPCMAELLKQDPKCIQVNFMFSKDNKDTSLEQIVNWYVSNPASGWTFRGVVGSDQRTTQFGDLYNKNVYYKMEFVPDSFSPNATAIFYNGPFPISNLSPKP